MGSAGELLGGDREQLGAEPVGDLQRRLVGEVHAIGPHDAEFILVLACVVLLGNDAYEAAFAQGRTMSMEQAIDLALSERVCI